MEARMEGMEDLYQEQLANDDTVIPLENLEDEMIEYLSETKDVELLRKIIRVVSRRIKTLRPPLGLRNFDK